MSGNITNPVLSLEVDDSGLTPGATAAAAALQKVGDTAVTTETALGKVSATASSLVNRFDPATKSANALEKAQQQLSTATDTLNRSVAAGDITQTQASGTLATLQSKVRALQDAHDNGLTPAVNSATTSAGNLAFAQRQLTVQTTQFFSSILSGQPVMTSFIQQGHGVVDVMESAGVSVGQLASGLGDRLKAALGAVLSPLGLAITAAAAAGVAVYALGAAAETSADRIAKLQASLQAVNGSGAGSSGQIANTASRSFAGTGLASLADSTAAAVAFLNQPSVVQTPANIERLIRDSANLAVVWNTTMPDAAKKLAAAMSNPGALAKQLADDNYAGMNDALARSVQLQQDAGDKAGAFATVLGVVEKAAHDASTTSKTELQQALAGLSGAFVKTGADGKTFGDTLGTAIDHVAAGSVTALTNVITALEKAYSYVSGLNLPDWLKTAITAAGGAVGSALNPVGGIISTGASLINGSSGSGSLPRGIRNNNPLNLSFAGQAGATSDGRFAIFPDMQSGIAADQAQLLSYQNNNGLNTVAAIVNKWAPPGENNTGGYALSVAQALGVAVDEPINLNNPATLQALTQAMSNVENGRGYNLNTLASGPLGTPDAVIPQQTVTAASVNNPAKTIQDALTAATAGSSFQTAAQAGASVKDYTAALAALAAQGITSGHDVDVLTEALTKAQKAQYDAIGPAAQLIQTIKEQITQQDELSAAWANGYAAEGQAVAQVKAEQQARTVAAPGTAAYADAVTRLTAANVALAAAQQSVQAGAALADQGQQLQYLQAETATLGQSADSRDRSLAILKEQQTIAKTLPDISQQEKDQLVAGAAAIATQTTNLQQTQAALSEVGSLATQAFDQIGSAISNSFLSGTGAAINWGNTVKAVIGTVIQEVAKLAILNPILNAVTGSNSVTLGGVIGALGGTTGTSSSGGALNLLSTGGTLASAANTLSGGSLLQSLGITGPNGLFSSLGLSSGSTTGIGGLFNSAYSGVTGFLNTGTGIGVDSAGSQVIESLGINAGSGLGGASIGALLGGAGAGFGLGSLAGGFEQSALGKTGPAPMIGAGVGALAGAAIGSIIPIIGTAIGGVLGGVLGGAGGGLIGPHVATPYSNIGISVGNGQLQLAPTLSQGDPNAAVETQAAQQTQEALNGLLDITGIILTGTGGVTRVGDVIDPRAPGKVSDLNAAFPSFTFGVPDQSTDVGRVLSSQVAGQSFSSVDQLSAVFNEVNTFINQTVPALKAFDVTSTGIGSYATAIANLQATFNPAIAEAQKLGFAESDLTAARDKALDAVHTQQAAQVQTDVNGIESSYLAAKAQVTGNSGDALNSALFTFDSVTAAQDRTQLQQEYQGIFGDAYASTETYVQVSAALEQSLGEQRLAIQTQYNNQIVAAAGTAVTSLLSYVQKLQGPNDSPLSPLAQYGLAKSQFNAVSGAAEAGDANSITNLPTYADALLSASRTVNGSGTGYAADYNSVLSSVSSVVSLGADALNQSFMAAQMQGQTAAIVTAIQSLQTQVAGLQNALTQANNAPARIAA